GRQASARRARRALARQGAAFADAPNAGSPHHFPAEAIALVVIALHFAPGPLASDTPARMEHGGRPGAAAPHTSGDRAACGLPALARCGPPRGFPCQAPCGPSPGARQRALEAVGKVVTGPCPCPCARARVRLRLIVDIVASSDA